MKLKDICSIEQSPTYKVLHLFGFKVNLRNPFSKDTWLTVKGLWHEYAYLRGAYISATSACKQHNHLRNYFIAQDLHKETFGPYRNCHQGQSVVLVATGPTLNYYIPIQGAKHVGVNKAICWDKAPLDYYFVTDYQDGALEKYVEHALRYPQLPKFYGYYNIYHPVNMMIPESLALRHQAKRFITAPCWSTRKEMHYNFEPDISRHPLHCGATVAITAMQFILYTNPKKIYLVGCDCAPSGHFDSQEFPGILSQFVSNRLKKEWKMLKDIRDWYYPQTEIISINPVGLKGLFTDEYTKKYLQEYPPTDTGTILILEK